MITYFAYEFIYSHPIVSLLIFFGIISGVIGCFIYFGRHSYSSLKMKKLFFGLAIVLAFFVVWLFLIPSKPEFPVEYLPLYSVDDYINGNAITVPGKKTRFLQAFLYGWKDWTKEGSYPLVTEDDWIIHVIDGGTQKRAWGIEYSKQELLAIAQEELVFAKNDNDNTGIRQAARIQSFIDILSRR